MKDIVRANYGSLLSLVVIITFSHSGKLAAQATNPSKSIALEVTDQEKRVMTFQDLRRVDGKKVSLSSYQQRYVVVCFTSNTCPYSIDYEERLKQLQQKFQDDNWSAVVLAINSNDHKDDSLEKMTSKAKEQEFNFDYLKDEDQAVAKTFDAVYTPEFFVLDRQRHVIYQGALDDATKLNDVTINYVLTAIESHRDGRPIEVKNTGARGCRIRFERRRKQK